MPVTALTPHLKGSQGVISSARRSAKAEVRGASPRGSTISPLCLSSHRSGFVNRYSSVQVRPGAPVSMVIMM